MKKLLLIMLAFSGSTYAMEKWNVYKAITKPEAATAITPPQITAEEKQKLSEELLEKLMALRGQGNKISTQQINAIEKLIDQGADVNFRNEWGRILLYAIATNNVQIVRLFLDKGANINAKDAYGEGGGLFYYIDYLRSGPGINIKRLLPQTAIIKLLIERGADINAVDEKRQNALMRAASLGLPEIVKLLLEGVSPSEIQQLRRTEIAHAHSYLGLLPPELMTLTTQYIPRADPNTVDSRNRTALAHAIEQLGRIEGNLRAYGTASEIAQRIRDYEEIIKILAPLTIIK